MAIKKQESYQIADAKFFQKSEKPYCIYEVDREKGIATITFNKPEKLNAATPGDLLELRDRVIDAEEDTDVKVVVFKGSGKCFSTGVDLDWIKQAYNEKGKERRPSQRYRHARADKLYGLRGFYQVVMTCLKATVAQVHGQCYGTAFQLAAVCDIVIASDDAEFTDPTYRFMGASPVDMVLLFHTIGLKRTKEMMLTGRPIGAKEAVEAGLINRAVPKAKLDEEVKKVVDMICRQPYDAIVTGKACFETAMDISGVAAGIYAGVEEQTWQTNIQFRPGEFNLIKSLKEKEITGAIEEEKNYFKEKPLR
ncbi:MAG: enoyl-CoA hydratase/isomerase family protein [Dehalococcoidia bacterium]|nr:enoyl-CoA hydratase/isomerase family protein [Dehalococcoidia bacterium]